MKFVITLQKVKKKRIIWLFKQIAVCYATACFEEQNKNISFFVMPPLKTDMVRMFSDYALICKTQEFKDMDLRFNVSLGTTFYLFGRLCFSPRCSRSWWFFSSFTGKWAWLPRAPRANKPEPAPVTGGRPGGCRPEGWGGSWTGGPWAAWERCCAWSCCCCKQMQRDRRQDGGQVGRLGNDSLSNHTLFMY